MFIGGCYSFPKYRTDIRAGAVKTMITGEGPVGKTGELLRAAGNAAVIAGIPLLMHTESGAGSLEALDILSKVGLNPERVIICHADRKKVDIRLNREIAKTGAYLSYDTVSLFDWTSTDAEIGLILDMIEAGFEEKLMVSTDTTIDRMKSYGGNVGLDYIPLEFLPKLENAGVAKDIILKLVRINPSKALMRV